jgi:hypothetical protein
MRTTCALLVTLILICPLQRLHADLKPTQTVCKLKNVALTGKDESAVRAIDSIGQLAAVPAFATEAVPALREILKKYSDPKNTRLLGHVVLAFGQAGANSIDDVPAIEQLADLGDGFLNGDIDTAVQAILAAATKPPAAGDSGAANGGDAKGWQKQAATPLDDLWKKVAVAKDNDSRLKILVETLSNSSNPDLLHFSLGLARAVAGEIVASKATTDLTAYWKALGDLVNGSNISVAIVAANDLGYFGTRAVVAYLDDGMKSSDATLKAVSTLAQANILAKKS